MPGKTQHLIANYANVVRAVARCRILGKLVIRGHNQAKRCCDVLRLEHCRRLGWHYLAGRTRNQALIQPLRRTLPNPAVLLASAATALLAFSKIGASAANCLREDALGTARVLSVDTKTFPRVRLNNVSPSLPLSDHWSACAQPSFARQVAVEFPKLVRRASTEGHTSRTISSNPMLSKSLGSGERDGTMTGVRFGPATRLEEEKPDRSIAYKMFKVGRFAQAAAVDDLVYRSILLRADGRTPPTILSGRGQPVPHAADCGVALRWMN
ncbi:hypothetical protein ABIC08_008949 [Bradyrhizobium sp. RT9b]